MTRRVVEIRRVLNFGADAPPVDGLLERGDATITSACCSISSRSCSTTPGAMVRRRRDF